MLNEAYGVTESRPFWKVWGEGLLLTVGLSLLYIVSTVLLMFGPRIGAWLADILEFGYVFEFIWNIVRWPIALCFVNFTAAALYYFTPDVQQKWKWVTPGSIFEERSILRLNAPLEKEKIQGKKHYEHPARVV